MANKIELQNPVVTTKDLKLAAEENPSFSSHLAILKSRERELREALATIAGLRKQLEEAEKTSAVWKLCAEKCNAKFALAVEREAAIKEAGVVEGVRKAAAKVSSLYKTAEYGSMDGGRMRGVNDSWLAILSLLPEPTEPGAGGEG